MYTYRRVLAHPLRFELRSRGFGDQDNNRYTKGAQNTRFIHRKTRQNVAILRLTEVTALMSNDLCARSQTPPSHPSSPPYEGICGIIAGDAGNAPKLAESKVCCSAFVLIAYVEECGINPTLFFWSSHVVRFCGRRVKFKLASPLYSDHPYNVTGGSCRCRPCSPSYEDLSV